MYCSGLQYDFICKLTAWTPIIHIQTALMSENCAGGLSLSVTADAPWAYGSAALLGWHFIHRFA